MRRFFILACVISVALGAFAPGLAAQERLALIIGNSAYKKLPLENPKNDAEDMAARLTQLGFRVWLGLDLNASQMKGKIQEFSEALLSARLGFFFFAGHGLNIGGRNYLVPIESGADALVDLDFVKSRMELASETNIILVDACRNDPRSAAVFAPADQNREKIGLGFLRPYSLDTIVGYSTQPGSFALDELGDRNSPYAKALLHHLRTPMLDVASLLARVRDDVAKETGNKQVPWALSALMAPLVLNTSGMSGLVQARGGPSEVAIRHIVKLAWNFTPPRLTMSDGKVVQIDKSNPASVVPPLDVVRDIVFVGKRSGYAKLCSIPRGWERNVDAFRAKVKGAGSWTDGQLLFFGILHNTVMSLMTGNVEMFDPDGKRIEYSSAITEFVRPPTCDASFKEAVIRRIESYERAR